MCLLYSGFGEDKSAMKKMMIEEWAIYVGLLRPPNNRAFTKPVDICDLCGTKATVIFLVPRCVLPLTAAE